MGCFRLSCYDVTGKPGVYRATLTFQRDDLLYDIANVAYVEGHVIAEEQECARHMVTDITQEGNVDRVTRILELVHAETVELLYPYTKLSVVKDDENYNDRFSAPWTYVIEMEIPTTFSKTTLRLLSKLIHEFMVCRVLHDWLGMTAPNAATKWMERAENVQTEISSALARRTGRVRRKMWPRW